MTEWIYFLRGGPDLIKIGRAQDPIHRARDLNETPMAYKAIDDVMRAQEDLVEVVATLRQVLCVKG